MKNKIEPKTEPLVFSLPSKKKDKTSKIIEVIKINSDGSIGKNLQTITLKPLTPP